MRRGYFLSISDCAVAWDEQERERENSLQSFLSRLLSCLTCASTTRSEYSSSSDLIFYFGTLRAQWKTIDGQCAVFFGFFEGCATAAGVVSRLLSSSVFDFAFFRVVPRPCLASAFFCMPILNFIAKFCLFRKPVEKACHALHNILFWRLLFQRNFVICTSKFSIL